MSKSANDNNNNNKNSAAGKKQKQQQAASAEPQPPPPFSRELDMATFPRLEYRDSKQRPNLLKGIHLGQRKLLLSEIEFLSLAQSGKLFAVEDVNNLSKDQDSTGMFSKMGAEKMKMSMKNDDSDNTNMKKSNNQGGADYFDLLIYAGAAPGGHTAFLRSLFPDTVAMLLIDPAPFDKDLVDLATSSNIHTVSDAGELVVREAATRPNKTRKVLNEIPLPTAGGQIKILHGLCTPMLCENIRTSIDNMVSSSRASVVYAQPPPQPLQRLRSVLFVSDIRVGDMSRDLTNAQATALIMKDNELQRQCCDMLQPDAAMLKFRPPFPRETDAKSAKYDPDDTTPNEINYYQGRVFFGVWAPKSSTEVRLIVTRFGGKGKGTKYNCRVFEEQLCYYNADDRYSSDVEAERQILKSYIESRKKKEADDALLSSSSLTVESVSKKISVALYGDDLFQPLESRDVFTEADARLWSLLFVGHQGVAKSHTATVAAAAAAAPSSSTPQQQQDATFSNSAKKEKEKEEPMTDVFQRLRKEITMEQVIKGDTSTDAMKEFWNKYATGSRLSEYYQFLPWIHAKLITKKPHQQQQQQQQRNQQKQPQPKRVVSANLGSVRRGRQEEDQDDEDEA